MQDQKTTRVLEVQLTEPELDARRKTLSELCVELTRTEERLLSAKTTVKRLNDARTTQTKVLESGNELRSVQCTIKLDGKRVRVVRDDTGDVIEDRPATAEERQTNLPGEVLRPANNEVYMFEPQPDDDDLEPTADEINEGEDRNLPKKSPRNTATPLGKGGKKGGRK